jgi:hypothetical protein
MKGRGVAAVCAAVVLATAPARLDPNVVLRQE